MKSFSNELAMEKKSIEMIKSLLYPWDFSSPELDVGIDFIVWPNTNNKPLPKKFLLQLKSTNSINTYYDFDIVHINGWQDQNEPVIIIYINIEKESFYYKWVDEIIISKGNKKTQRIHFDKFWNKSEGKRAKAEIIQKLFPMVASSYQHTIDIDTGRTGMIAETEKLFGYNDLETIDLTKIINDIQEQYGIRERIRILKEYLDCEPENQNYITGLSIEYINLNDYNSAIIEFNKLRRLGNPLGEIGIKILNEQDYRIAKLLNGSEIKYYLQFKKADYTLSKVEIIIKGKDVTIDLDKNFRYELSEKIEGVKITNTEKTEIELASLLIAPFINGILETKYSVEILKYL